MERIEYRVRPITRYIVTRYHRTENTGGNCERGQYENEDTAFEVATALCRAEHEQLGWQIGDERIQYPTRPSEADAAPAGKYQRTGR